MLHQGLCVLIEIGSKRNLALQDIPVDSHRVLVVEGIDACVHLVDENSQSPPVDCFSVALVENDFWGDVLRSAADREGPALGQELRKAEVSKFEISVVADKEVLRL